MKIVRSPFMADRAGSGIRWARIYEGEIDAGALYSAVEGSEVIQCIGIVAGEAASEPGSKWLMEQISITEELGER